MKNNDLKHRLDLREKSLDRWKKYLSGGNKPLAKIKNVKKYVNELETEIVDLRSQLSEVESGKETKIMSIDDLLKGVGEAVGNFVKDAAEYLNLSKMKRAKNTYVILAVLFLIFFLFRGKSSITGYSVLETVTNSNLVSIVLVFILGIMVLFYYKLN